MTQEEDRNNAIINEQMQACEHDVKRTKEKGVFCTKCGGQFALMLLGRLAPVFQITED